MENKLYDFVSMTKNDKGVVRAVLTGYVCNGDKTKIVEKEVNDKKVLELVLKVNSKVGVKLDVTNGEYDKSKSYDDFAFIRVSVWDEKKFKVIKMAQNILIEGALSKKKYIKDGKEIEYFSMNVGEYDSLRVLQFRHDTKHKPDDFESDFGEGTNDEMPF